VVVKIRADRVTLDPGQPLLFVREEKSIMDDLERRMKRVHFESRKLVRVRTGKLMSSGRLVSGSLKRGPYVDLIYGGRGIRYTMIEHDGSPPHIIRARRKKFLRFTHHGQVVFRRSVKHPGTTGTLFMTMALPYAAI